MQAHPATQITSHCHRTSPRWSLVAVVSDALEASILPAHPPVFWEESLTTPTAIFFEMNSHSLYFGMNFSFARNELYLLTLWHEVLHCFLFCGKRFLLFLCLLIMQLFQPICLVAGFGLGLGMPSLNGAEMSAMIFMCFLRSGLHATGSGGV